MSSLNLKYLGGKKWVVTKNFTINEYTIPKGFITDIDSVPRIPFIYSTFKDRAIQASVLHDYLYSIRMPRKQADEVYYRVMVNTNVRKIYRLPIYSAVRLFGWIFYPKEIKGE
jgi:hypothetical protein